MMEKDDAELERLRDELEKLEKDVATQKNENERAKNEVLLKR